MGFYHGKDRTFTNHDIQLEIGDTFYLSTDGFMDQKGGKDNKKFMSRKFKSTLLEIHDQPMFDQQDILDKKLSDWMGSNSQMDDILVVGVRVQIIISMRFIEVTDLAEHEMVRSWLEENDML